VVLATALAAACSGGGHPPATQPESGPAGPAATPDSPATAPADDPAQPATPATGSTREEQSGELTTLEGEPDQPVDLAHRDPGPSLAEQVDQIEVGPAARTPKVRFLSIQADSPIDDIVAVRDRLLGEYGPALGRCAGLDAPPPPVLAFRFQLAADGRCSDPALVPLKGGAQASDRVADCIASLVPKLRMPAPTAKGHPTAARIDLGVKVDR